VHLFGYGSLVVPGARRFTLQGWRRVWGVAMDNRVAIPGYKVYEDSQTGERPPVVVTFLDLVADPESEVVGSIIEAPDLATLDRRERQYRREEVVDGVVAYVGRQEGRERAASGRTIGIAVIQRSYFELCREVLGDGVPPPDLPLRDLRRVDL
jgi:hypothetical protein